jgi:hypothetical protein
MASIKSIIEDYKTPPVVVKSATVRPARVARVQSRADIKRTMRDLAPEPRR